MRLDVHISFQALNGLKALKGVGEEVQEEAPTIGIFSDLKFEGFNLMFRVKNHQGHLFRVKQSDPAKSEKSEKKLHNKIAGDRILIHMIYAFTFREGSAFVTS